MFAFLQHVTLLHVALVVVALIVVVNAYLLTRAALSYMTEHTALVSDTRARGHIDDAILALEHGLIALPANASARDAVLGYALQVAPRLDPAIVTVMVDAGLRGAAQAAREAAGPLAPAHASGLHLVD